MGPQSSMKIKPLKSFVFGSRSGCLRVLWVDPYVINLRVPPRKTKQTLQIISHLLTQAVKLISLIVVVLSSFILQAGPAELSFQLDVYWNMTIILQSVFTRASMDKGQGFTFISNSGLHWILAGLDPEHQGKNVVWATDYKAELPIAMSHSGSGSEPAITISQAFKTTALTKPNYPALSTKRAGKWVTLIYEEYYKDACNFGKALISLGVPVLSTVNIIGFNSPQWSISFTGSILGSYVPIGIYTTNGPEACAYIAKHSQCKVVVVENQSHLQKYIHILDQIPLVQHFVIYDGEVPLSLPERIKGKVYDWKYFLSLGNKLVTTEKQDSLAYRIDCQKPGSCCTFIYTSGTTGTPKAVMLSHDNYTWLCLKLKILFDFKDGGQRVMSLLPLSHVAAQLVDIVAPLYNGIHVYFVDVTALQGNLTAFLLDIRPTIFMSVPRLWEKIFDKLDLMINSSTGVKRKLFEWARSMGNKGTHAQLTGGQTPFGWSLAKKLIFNKIKVSLGIDQCKLLVVSAAPLQPSVRSFFMDFNIPLVNCYGMSEVAGPHTFSNFNNWDCFDEGYFREAGEPIAGVTIKILNPDHDGCGEICMRGRNRFMGYYKDEAETEKCIDSQGYLHSGDVGKIDQKGNLYITGRIKELLITAGGENVAPVMLEQQISKELPQLAYVIVIGDHKKYLSSLVVLKAQNGALSEDVRHILAEIGSSAKTLKEARVCPLYIKRVQDGIDKANLRAPSKAQKVIRFHILEDQFSIANGVLTPALKVKRKQVHKKFHHQIESMYGQSKL